MADLEIISKNPITLVELKSRIDTIVKSKEDSSVRVTRVQEYLQDFVEISLEDAEQMKAKINALEIQRLKERIVIKIIDTQPKTVDELKILFTGENVTLKQEDLVKILEVVQNK